MNKQEILNEIEKMENRLADFKQELNKDEEWKPKDGEEYWYYDRDTEDIRINLWEKHRFDKIRRKNKIIFKTEAEAQRYTDYQKAKEEYSYEFSNKEWENNSIDKYYIRYDYSEKELAISNNVVYKDIGKAYFKTKAQAQEFINKYKDEILEFEFGIKEE